MYLGQGSTRHLAAGVAVLVPTLRIGEGLTRCITHAFHGSGNPVRQALGHHLGGYPVERVVKGERCLFECLVIGVRVPFKAAGNLGNSGR